MNYETEIRIHLNHLWNKDINLIVVPPVVYEYLVLYSQNYYPLTGNLLTLQHDWVKVEVDTTNVDSIKYFDSHGSVGTFGIKMLREMIQDKYNIEIPIHLKDCDYLCISSKGEVYARLEDDALNFDGVNTVEQFEQLYQLLTGETLKVRTNDSTNHGQRKRKFISDATDRAINKGNYNTVKNAIRWVYENKQQTFPKKQI